MSTPDTHLQTQASSPTGLVERHIAFLDALRGAGLPVSLVEGLDAVDALSVVEWGDRTTVRDTYAATLVKKQTQRPTFDALFELYFPRMVGEGRRVAEAEEEAADQGAEPEARAKDGPQALEEFRELLAEALAEGDEERMRQLAAEAVGRFGAMPGRGPGLSSWSSYTALRRLAPDELVARIISGLRRGGWSEEEAARAINKRVGGWTTMVEADARRRIAEEKGPDHVAKVAVRSPIDRLDFLTARRSDLEEMRRQIYPLARRLATRLTQEHHAKRRGTLDFRRTVRASINTGGVPIDTRHKPKRPHRTELVVLCDVSGSVANFANFTLMLVFALREAFQGVRAFMFIDDIHEVTSYFDPGNDMVDTMTELAKASANATVYGRTNYGRSFNRFLEEHREALGPKSSVLILGDARSNYADLQLDALKTMKSAVRHAWWLNPEALRHWNTGDSAAREYGDVVDMVECRNLTQLESFVHEIL
ncbi:vWA domain-containing protein [Nocardioides insulae]|uniref:vWA domain-containing protein n=1 Tax=Nocardioides insulae TaxID=394734 RepID=UPI000428D85A|nr:VWA domain-containing protein [Nocardioides insulae]